MALGALGLLAQPRVLPIWGLESFYAAVAILVLPLITTIRYLPERGSTSGSRGSLAALRPILISGLLGVGAIFMFYLALGGIWTFVERMGDAAGLSSKTMGNALFVSSLMGVAGAGTATILSVRFGRFKPIVAGFMMLIGAILMLFGTLTVALFFLATALFKFGWTFVLPYLLACITNLDPSGRLIVFTNLIIGTGLAAGPALAALFLGNALNYRIVVTQGLVFIVIAFILITPLAAKQPKFAIE